MDHSDHHSSAEPPFWKSKIGIALIMLAVIGGGYVAREHYGHLSQALPYLILLLCPLMHSFDHTHGSCSQESLFTKLFTVTDPKKLRHRCQACHTTNSRRLHEGMRRHYRAVWRLDKKEIAT